MNLDVLDRPKLILLGAVFIIIIVIFFLIIPGRKNIERLNRAINQNERNISEMLKLERELLGLRRNDVRAAVDEMGSFQILSFLDQLATTKGVQEQIISMKVLNTAPDGMTLDGITGDVVRVELKEIQLQPLVDFLFEIEHSQNRLKISKIHVRRQNVEPSVLDVVILVGERVSSTT
jgi:type II secretory pathway component PulM